MSHLSFILGLCLLAGPALVEAQPTEGGTPVSLRFALPAGFAGTEVSIDRLDRVTGEVASSPCEVEGDSAVCPVPAGRWDLTVRARGWVPILREGLELGSATEATLDGLEWRRGVEVCGWLEAEHRDLLVDVELGLRPAATGKLSSRTEGHRLGSRGVPVEIGADGRICAAGISPGKWEILVRGAGILPSTSSFEVSPGQESIELPQPVVVHAVVELTVFVDPPVGFDGEPWRLLLRQDRRGGPTDLWTVDIGIDGVATASDASLGMVVLQVLDASGSRWAEQEVEVAPGIGPLTIEIPSVRVEGVARTGDEPIRNSQIVFGTRWQRPSIVLETDDHGSFEGYLTREGPWPVAVEWSDGTSLELSEPVLVEKPAGARAARIEVSLHRTAVAGVVELQGEPVPEAMVHIRPTADSPRPTSKLQKGARAAAVADEEGHFSFQGVSPGPRILRAETATHTSPWVRIDLEDGTDRDDLVLDLQPKRTLKGVLLGPAGAMAGVEILPVVVGSGGSHLPSYLTRTGVDGKFEVLVPPGATRATLVAVDPALAINPLTVDLENSAELIYRVGSPGRAVVPDGDFVGVPRLFGPHGEISFGRVIDLASRLGRFTLDEGGMTIEGLQPGEWRLCGAMESGAQCVSMPVAPGAGMEGSR